jgi:hypothetical protein
MKAADEYSEIAKKLVGARLPHLLFSDYDGGVVDLDAISLHATVLYIQPGCNSVSSNSQDMHIDVHIDELQHDAYRALRHLFAGVMPKGSAIAALSAAADPTSFLTADRWLRTHENSPEQRIAHHLLDDAGLSLAAKLPLPTFKRGDRRLYQRITLLITEGRISKVFYPVDARQDARQALAWFQTH